MLRLIILGIFISFGFGRVAQGSVVNFGVLINLIHISFSMHIQKSKLFCTERLICNVPYI